jgi:hypothetical protein
MADITKTIAFVVDDAQAQKAAAAMDAAVAQVGETAKKTTAATAAVGQTVATTSAETAKTTTAEASKAVAASSKAAGAAAKASEAATTKAMAKGMVLVGVAQQIVHGLLASVGAAADLGLSLGQASAKFGVPVEEVNKFRYALGLSAEDAGAFAERMKRFGRTDADVARVADEMAGARNSAQRMAMASRLLGAEWAEKLAPALLQGGDAMREALAQGGRAGGMTLQAAKAFREMDVAMRRVQFGAEGLVGELAVGLAPIFKQVTGWVSDGVRWMTEFAKKIDLTRLMGVGAAVGIGTLTAALGGPLLTAIGGAVKAWGPWGVATGVAIAAGDDFLAWINGRGSLIGTKLNEWFGPGASDTGRQYFYMIGQAAVQAFSVIGKIVDQVLGGLEYRLDGVSNAFRLLTGTSWAEVSADEEMKVQVRKQRSEREAAAWDDWAAQKQNAIANKYEDVRAKIVATGGTVAPRMLDTAPVYGPPTAPATPAAQGMTQSNQVTIYAGADPRQISDIVSRELRTNARMAASNTPGAVPQRQ